MIYYHADIAIWWDDLIKVGEGSILYLNNNRSLENRKFMYFATEYILDYDEDKN